MASSRSSGLKAAGAVIAAGRNRLNAFSVITDGTNAVTLILYDNASAASGDVIGKAVIPGATRFAHVLFENPVVAENGIYAAVTGTGAEYLVYFGG